MALKINAKFEGKLNCAFQNDMRNLANFHRLENSDFFLESKMVELNQNKNLKQLDRPDSVRKLYFTLEKRDAFPAAKICKEGFRKVFNVWTKSHFSNSDVG